MDKDIQTKISQSEAILGIKEKELNDTYVYEMKIKSEILKEKDNVCSLLADLYKNYIGKKVEILFEFEDYWNGRKEVVNKKIIGFLKGFDHKNQIVSGIKPVVMRVKKNGSESMVPYNTFECFSYKHIKEIKIVE